MKKLYLLSILCLMTARIALSMDDDKKITGQKRKASTEEESTAALVAAIKTCIKYNIKNGDNNPDLLLKAVKKLDSLLPESSVKAINKKNWHNLIVIKTNRMIELNKSRAQNEKFNLKYLIEGIQFLTTSIYALHPDAQLVAVNIAPESPSNVVGESLLGPPQGPTILNTTQTLNTNANLPLSATRLFLLRKAHAMNNDFNNANNNNNNNQPS